VKRFQPGEQTTEVAATTVTDSQRKQPIRKRSRIFVGIILVLGLVGTSLVYQIDRVRTAASRSASV